MQKEGKKMSYYVRVSILTIAIVLAWGVTMASECDYCKDSIPSGGAFDSWESCKVNGVVVGTPVIVAYDEEANLVDLMCGDCSNPNPISGDVTTRITLSPTQVASGGGSIGVSVGIGLVASFSGDLGWSIEIPASYRDIRLVCETNGCSKLTVEQWGYVVTRRHQVKLTLSGGLYYTYPPGSVATLYICPSRIEYKEKLHQTYWIRDQKETYEDCLMEAIICTCAKS
jgi:hypothetical protein